MDSSRNFDATFNGGGKFQLAGIGASNDFTGGIAIQSDDKIVAARYTYIATHFAALLIRYNTHGTFDTTFNTTGSGYATFTFGAGNDVFNSLALQADGQIVAGGYTQPLSGGQKRVHR